MWPQWVQQPLRPASGPGDSCAGYIVILLALLPALSTPTGSFKQRRCSSAVAPSDTSGVDVALLRLPSYADSSLEGSSLRESPGRATVHFHKSDMAVHTKRKFGARIPCTRWQSIEPGSTGTTPQLTIYPAQEVIARTPTIWVPSECICQAKHSPSVI